MQLEIEKKTNRCYYRFSEAAFWTVSTVYIQVHCIKTVTSLFEVQNVATTMQKHTNWDFYENQDFSKITVFHLRTR